MTARADRPRFSRPPRNEAKVQRRLRLARTAASPDNVRVFRRPTLVIRIALACAALLLLDAAVRAQTPPASWLDRPLANWNRASEQVPGARVVRGGESRDVIVSRCKLTPPKSTAAERAVDAAGWIPFWNF